MRKIFNNKFLLFLILPFVSISFYYWWSSGSAQVNIPEEAVEIKEVKAKPELPVKKDRIFQIEIVPDSTYGELMKIASVTPAVSMEIYDASVDVYDLAKIRVGRVLNLVFDKDSDEFKELNYQISVEEELFVRKNESGDWQAEVKKIEYEIKEKFASGEVKSSMYEAALENGIDERAIIELANAFQWTIDFAMDPRVGDTFKFVYEELYLDGEYVMPGTVLAGKYINDGKEFNVYYFEESEDNKGYFDEDGNSVQKMFLKAPVSFKYISSGFTNGMRYVEAFNVSTGHKAIDYAAALGSPIRSVGNGTVTSAGWNSGGYGYLTKIRHNGTYSTNYAHQSKIAVKVGQKVTQGQIIGYVGSTGFSTGPHLHYEMLKNGVKINPLKEILPPGKPIKEENGERFLEEIKKYQDLLK